MNPKMMAIGGLAALVLVGGAVAGISVMNGGASHTEAHASTPQDFFLHGMIPHHQGAIDMAVTALTKAEHEEIKQLARNIQTSQQQEIELMQRLLGPTEANKAHTQTHGGDDHGPAGAKKLANANPFDKAFLDLMIPHHESAIKAAKEILAQNSDAEVQRLAKAIIDAQEKEIVQMKEWRAAWYGN